MMSNMHTPQMVSSLTRRSSMRGSLALKREASMEEKCAMVDKLIQQIQKQIRDDLGFKEIVVSTGEEADESTTMTGMRASLLLATSLSGSQHDANFLFTRRHSTSLNPEDPSTTSSTAFGSLGGASTVSMSSSGGNVPSSSTSSSLDDVHKMRKALSTLNLGNRTISESSSSSSSATSCGDCARGTVYVSPNYDTKKRLLVIVPYREAGIWSRSIVLRQRGSGETSGSMLAYLTKALVENYGIIIMNPAAQFCHPKNHVEQVWDQLVAPLTSDVYIVAYSRGSQLVKHLLGYDNGQGVMQDRLKALALVEPSHYVDDNDSYFTRRMLARRAAAWLLSNEVDVGCKIPKAEARHGCVCLSAGAVPSTVAGSSGAWALEMVMSSVFGSLAARSGEAAGVTVNHNRISSCGICHRKLGVLNRRLQCSWCQVKYCSRCCADKFVPSFGSWRVCSMCQTLPCLIDPRRKHKSAKNHKSPSHAHDEIIERCSVFIQPSGVDEISLSDFEIIKLIGRGACGRVKLVRKKDGADEGAFYAMKAIKKKLVIQRGLVEATNAERRILHLIKHPYVATLCYAFQNEAKLYLLSKYYPGGNLLDQMRLVRRFTEDRTRLYAAQVALAIHHLHQNNVIYRDLKLENVLVGSDGHIALTDFGMSKENMVHDGRTSTFVGTYQMMAPEVFTGKSYSRLVDWWALGVMVYEMIDGRTPFNAKTNKLIKERITSVDLKFSPRFTDDAKDFVARLLTKSETNRLGAGPNGFNNIRTHPWFHGIDWDAVERKEVQFEGQDELMKSHAKEYSVSDIFDTYMNTLEVPIDTPASVKSSSGDLFNDFEYNHLEVVDGEVVEPEYESPSELAEEGIFELESELVGSHMDSEDSEAGDHVGEHPVEQASERASRVLTSHESHFDISLLRPEQATDFENSAVSSLSSESNASRTEDAADSSVMVENAEEIGDHLLSNKEPLRFEEVLSSEAHSPTESSTLRIDDADMVKVGKEETIVSSVAVVADVVHP